MTKDLSEGVVLDLDMETLEDYSGNGNNGVATGTSLTVDKNNCYNKARSFNGSSDYISVGNNNTLSANNMTYRFLVKSASSTIQSNDKGLLFKAPDTGYSREIGIYFQGNTGKIIINGFNGSSKAASGIITNESYYDGKWHHVVGIKQYGVSGDTLYLYIDGNLKGTYVNSYNIVQNSANLEFGRVSSTSSSDRYFNGTITKPKVWNRVLTVKEVSQDYAEISHNYQGLFDGLVLGMDFHGDAKDFSDNNNDGTLNGTPMLTTDNLNIDNSAYDFDGSNDYITVTDAPSLNGFTSFSVLAWFKYTGTKDGNYRMIMNKYRTSGGTSVGWFFGKAGSDGLIFRSDNSNSSIQVDSNDWDVDKWYFLAGTYDGSNSKIYLNGEFYGEVATTTNPGDTGNELAIGARNRDYGEKWIGKIRLPMIFNKALSLEEIKTLYNLTKNGYVYPYPKQITEGVTE